MANKKLCKTLKIVAGAAGVAFVGMRLIAKKKKADYTYKNEPAERNPFEGKKVVFIKDENDAENADGVRGHLEDAGVSCSKESLYGKYGKRALDVALSFGGLVVLSPVYAAIALAIKIEDPGPVLFTQKRLGQNKEYFKLHKFRSMKVSTPHDVPTHQLENPDQYITKVGKFIRAHSLDELPQIWDIFVGNMSVIGPRPGLWNQDLLTAERDKYGANDVKPGLTGWAQINGRDELEIPVKAKLDGEYVQKQSFLFDIKCFLWTISKVLHDDSVVEGGTGHIREKTNDNFEYLGSVPKRNKKILITGKHSYIGEQIKEYLEKESDKYQIDSIETKGYKPKVEDFIGYDVVVNVAGIAHINEKKIKPNVYYKVNRDLCVEIAMNAKQAGVGHFITLSSMNVYGKQCGHIIKTTKPRPTSAYGKSKYEADIILEKMSNTEFKLAILRPPMVYGKKCKGNYQKLRMLAIHCPIFPVVKNQRSMIYVGNLCEFVKNIIDDERSGLFFPQNKEYVNTTEMVRLICQYNNSNIFLVKGFSKIIEKIPNEMVKKVFGDLTYEKTDIVGKFSFDQSIELSEL